jgi:hypothetical protein
LDRHRDSLLLAGGATGTTSFARLPGTLGCQVTGAFFGLGKDVRRSVVGAALPLDTAVAGAVFMPGTGDGIGTAARFEHLSALFDDGQGHLFAVDYLGCNVRRIDLATSNVTTFAGTAGTCQHADGAGPGAHFDLPQGLTGDGQSLYVTEDNTVRRIDLATAVVTTLAGSPGKSGFDDGVGSSARFNQPHGMALDGAGGLLIGDLGNGTIRKLTLATGAVSTILGVPNQQGVTTGSLAAARLNSPYALRVLPGGDLIVLDGGEPVVLRARMR